MESGGSTPWIYRLLCELGHEVVVVNPRRLRLIAESTLKSDRIEAEILARLSRFDLELLRPVYQRSPAGQALRTKIRVRSTLVRTRVALINQIKGTLRSQGVRFSSTTASSFVAIGRILDDFGRAPPGGGSRYSYRNASIGSSLEAFPAG